MGAFYGYDAQVKQKVWLVGLMTRGNIFHGSLVALITPFRDGKVDEAAFAKLVAWHIEQGTQGLVPCGTTGESPTLSHAEHKRLVSLCVEVSAGRVPVMAGTGSNSTQEAIALTRHAETAGADGALVVVPYYNKPTPEGLVAHFSAIHDAVRTLPIFIYNIPGRCVVDMSVDTMTQLAALPRIIGVKDATHDLDRLAQQHKALGAKFVQLCGEDALAYEYMRHGGGGCISVTANIAPALSRAFHNACGAGDFATALEIHEKLLPLHQALFSETSPQPVKYAMSLLGFCENTLRLPLVQARASSCATVRAVMQDLALIPDG